MPRWWNFNHTTALVVIGLAALLLAAVPSQVAAPRTLFGRQLTALDPTLYPRLVLAALLVLGVWYLALARRIRDASLLPEVGWSGFFNIGVTLACLLAYAYFLPRAGFLVSSTVLMLALTLFYGNRNLVLALVIALLVPAAIYYALTRLMLVALPEFPFF